MRWSVKATQVRLEEGQRRSDSAGVGGRQGDVPARRVDAAVGVSDDERGAGGHRRTAAHPARRRRRVDRLAAQLHHRGEHVRRFRPALDAELCFYFKKFSRS